MKPDGHPASLTTAPKNAPSGGSSVKRPPGAMTAELSRVPPIDERAETRKDDEHPAGAFNEDGRKLALVGCSCEYCTFRLRTNRRERFDI